MNNSFSLSNFDFLINQTLFTSERFPPNCVVNCVFLFHFPQQIIQQAGQVWFPDSAFKTSQAIKDFNREGLPLMVFANWRGFSGGMKGDWPALGWRAQLVSQTLQQGREGLSLTEPMDVHHLGLWGIILPLRYLLSCNLNGKIQCFTIPYKISDQSASVIQVDYCYGLAFTGE